VPNQHTTPHRTARNRQPTDENDGHDVCEWGSVTLLGELILVTSSVAVSLGLSRLALGELFRLVRIDSARSSQDATRQ
jgi:hypothetical protein